MTNRTEAVYCGAGCYGWILLDSGQIQMGVMETGKEQEASG